MSPRSLYSPDPNTVERVVAVVLGGGRGTRLYPLTRERAKPAVPVAGRYRLVDIPLSNCINSGINRIFVLTQFNSHSLHRHINESYKFDVFSRGFVEILAAEQTVENGDWFQGTADAIRRNLWHLRNTEASHVLILSGDHLYRMDYRDFLARHLETHADITVSVLPVTAAEAGAFGILKVEQDGRITEFVEKPQTEDELDHLKTPETLMNALGYAGVSNKKHLASMGVYLFRREVLETILETRKDWVDFGKHVIPESLKTCYVYAYLFDGFWEDIGTVRSYYNVSMRLVDPDPPFAFFDPERPIYTHPRYLPGSHITDASISNSILCEGTRVHRARIEHSIVGIRSIIRDDVEILKSILMGADYFDREPLRHTVPLGIGRGTKIERAIIDKNARIGAHVVIRGHPDLPQKTAETYAIVDGIVVVLKNAVIPDGTRIG